MSKKWNKLSFFKLIFNLLLVAVGIMFLYSTCINWFYDTWRVSYSYLLLFLIESGALAEVCFIVCGIIGACRCRTSYKQDLIFGVVFWGFVSMLLDSLVHIIYDFGINDIVMVISLLASLIYIVFFFLKRKEKRSLSVSVNDAQPVNIVQTETAAPQPSSTPTDTFENQYSKAELILKYKKLCEDGVITEDDYNAKKAELLK